MRPVFFKLTLWNDPQKGAKRPAEWGACHGANRHPLRDNCGNLSLCHSALCITGAAMQHMYAGWTDHHDVDIVSRSSPSEEY